MGFCDDSVRARVALLVMPRVVSSMPHTSLLHALAYRYEFLPRHAQCFSLSTSAVDGVEVLASGRTPLVFTDDSIPTVRDSNAGFIGKPYLETIPEGDR